VENIMASDHVVFVIVISTEIQKSYWNYEIRASYSGAEDVSIVGCYTMPMGRQVLTIKHLSALIFRFMQSKKYDWTAGP
jgi:hypothetical protein